MSASFSLRRLVIGAMIMLACAEMLPAPRVALLFTTRGPMPLEDIWRTFLMGGRNQPAPLVSRAEFDVLMGEDQLPDVQRRVQLAGQTTPSLRLQTASCTSWSRSEVRPYPRSTALWPRASSPHATFQ
jgi:hypothetical protein